MDWELVVSDASDDSVSSVVLPSRIWNRVRLIPEKPRLGCTKGYNVAFRQASGEWVMWINDDCEVDPGYAETAIEFMRSHPEIGLGAFYYSDPNHIGWKVNTCMFGMLYANFGILSRKLGDKVGWFDEDLTMYGNDNSLTYRILMAGKGVAAIPNARIIHHSTKDAHRIENNNYGYRQQQGDLLRAKYTPHSAAMRAVYHRTAVGALA